MAKRDEFLAVASKLAAIGLASGGVLVFFLFCIFFYNYSWTGERQFTSAPLAAIYYGVPLVLAALLFSSLWLRPINRIRLFVFLVGASASVYTLEFFLDWRYSFLYASTQGLMGSLEDSKDKKRDAAVLARDWGIAVDTRTAGETLADLQRENPDAVPIMTFANQLSIRQADGSIKSSIAIDGQEVVPLASASNRVTLVCNEIGQWITYRSDGHGFNNPAEIWQRERVDIAALGGAYVQGWCVPGDKNFMALIRQRHPATLNLGSAGNGPLLMLATLKEYSSHFMPKTVLWFYFEGGDLADLETEMSSPLLRHYLKDGFTQTVLARQPDIDRAIIGDIPRLRNLAQRNRERRRANAFSGRVDNALKLATLRERLRLIGGVDTADADVSTGPHLDVFRGILRQAKMQVDGWGGHMIFVYLPSWLRYSDSSVTSPRDLARGEVLKLVGDLGIPIVDVNEGFEAHDDPLSLFPFRRPGHYNEIGHRLVAEEVLKTLSLR